jgi:hypothetical protein
VAASIATIVWWMLDCAARLQSLSGVCMGGIAGLVGIMAAGVHLDVYGAMVTGFLGAFFAWCALVLRLMTGTPGCGGPGSAADVCMLRHDQMLTYLVALSALGLCGVIEACEHCCNHALMHGYTVSIPLYGHYRFISQDILMRYFQQRSCHEAVGADVRRRTRRRGTLTMHTCRFLKGRDEPLRFARVVAMAALTGSLSAAFLCHPLFGGAQWATVFATQGIVQVFAAAVVVVWSVVGTSVAVGIVRVLLGRGFLHDEDGAADAELAM